VVKPVETQVVLNEVALPRIQVNVAGTNASRYVQVDAVVRVSDPSMLDLFEKQSAGTPQGRQREIMALAIRVIGDKPLNSLLTVEGQQALANELKASLNDLIADSTNGMITDVYFCGFLFQ
jgi:flagellar basal body-associated protein FliL